MKILKKLLMAAVVFACIAGGTLSPVHATEIDETTDYVKTNCYYYILAHVINKKGINLANIQHPNGLDGHMYEDAATAGFSVGLTPRADSVACYANHYAYVDYVNSDNTIHVHESNIRNALGQLDVVEGDRPWGIGENEFSNNNPETVLMGFIYLDTPRSAVASSLGALGVDDITSTTARPYVTYLLDSTTANTLSQVTCYMSESKDAVAKATPASHEGTVFYSMTSAGELNIDAYYFVNQGRFYFNTGKMSLDGSDNYPAYDLKDGTVYYYKFYAKDAQREYYSDVKDFASDSDTKQIMYRLYNPNSGEHFYTGNVDERNSVIAAGWSYEGTGWVAPKSSNTPVYRMYNAVGGEHHYTIDTGERDALVNAGWNYEGIGWYSDDAKTTPLYRQYNPNAFSCNHNYTTSKDENDYLVSIGWNYEGISWYGL